VSVSGLFGETLSRKTAKSGFWLFRYFLLISVLGAGALLVLSALGLWLIFPNFVMRDAEDDAIHLATVISDREMRDFTEAGGGLLSIPQERLAELDLRLRSYLHPFGIVKIKIFNVKTQIVYSTDSKIVGRVDPENPKLQMALIGAATSKHESKDAIWDFTDEQRKDVEIIETYVPMYGADGSIVGAFEVYKDVTAHLARANKSMVFIWVALVVLVVAVSIGRKKQTTPAFYVYRTA